jgi:putative acyl-CoA dehydrogenase
MQNVLADLALDSEAAMALSLRVARAVDAAARDPREAAFARIATAIGTYWVCKRCAPFVNEAQECLGGAGYVEESMLPRLYRQAPLNSIWEGSGNVQCLDVLRALDRQPETRETLITELRSVAGANAVLDAHASRLVAALELSQWPEDDARTLVESLAHGLQAALLLRAGDPVVGAAFCDARLGERTGRTYGTLPSHVPALRLIDRAFAE